MDLQVEDHRAAEERARRSLDERIARGKGGRASVPRSSHARLPLANRTDPLALLAEQAHTRLDELMPVRYGRMAASPFGFLRGSATVMAADLARTPSTGIRAQLCGDAHLRNFGLFGTPERNLSFDITDFDETLPGPWEWDLKRLLASIEIAGRQDGFSADDRRACLLATARAYREAMAGFAEQRNLEVWYASMDAERAVADYEHELTPRQVKRKRKAIARARRRDSEHAFGKLTELVGGKPRIASAPPLIVPHRELAEELDREALALHIGDVMAHYTSTLDESRQALFQQYRFVDLARKVVGVGSVGTRCWTVLLVGVDSGDPLLMQIKEAQSSVLERFACPSAYPNHGERVVTGQRLMQAHSDILLGWTRGAGADGASHDYYLRQLRNWKGSFPIEEMSPSAMAIYGRMCGWTLARAHARSGDRVAIAAYLGSGEVFDRAVATFADAYATQTERDHEALVRAIRNGQIDAEMGL
jgi:uncharacterized protein (DUF2252 family)